MAVNAQPHVLEKVAGFPFFFPNVFSSASTNHYARRKGGSFGGGGHYCVIPTWHLLSPLSFSMEAF